MLQVQELVGPAHTHSFATLDELCARYPWLRRYQPRSLEHAAQLLAETATVLLPLVSDVHPRLTKSEPQTVADLPPRRLTAFDAARWLTGRSELPAADERRALWLEEGDAVAGALRAYGEPVTAQSRAAVKAWLRAMARPSGPSDPVSVKIVSGDEPAATQIRRAAHSGQLVRQDRALRAADPESRAVWTLLQESGGCAARATAFCKIADAWGLGHFVCTAAKVMLDDHPYLAEQPCPTRCRSLADLEQEASGFARLALAPLLSSGALHRWAVLDFVLGNGDRTAEAVRVDPDRGTAFLVSNGGAFAETFSPPTDQRSFLPAYMTVWGPERWTCLSPAEKRRAWPAAEALEEELGGWLAGLSEEPVKTVCAERGLDVMPVLGRLTGLNEQAKVAGFGEALARAWCG